jgi:hypothetical protein
MQVISKLEYTNTSALITQDGFFGKHTCRIVIPFDKIDLVAKSLSDMYFNWQSQITNLITHELLYFELKISDNQTIEIEEGIGNDRNQDNDEYALYDIYGEKMFSNFYYNYHNVVVFKVQGAFILSELLKTKETFTWETKNQITL